MTHPLHTPEPLTVKRTPREGTCPRCGREVLRAYPVVAETGWLNVVKCQHCLHSVERQPWARLGPVQLLSDSI